MAAVRVVCVLRSGGDFTPEYVYRLKAGVDKHLTGHEFLCLTDMDVSRGTNTLPLETDWPGWWSKIELFRLTGKNLFFDLDTIITGDLHDLAYHDHHFTMIRDVGRYDRPASGVMAWNGDFRWIYNGFTTRDIPYYMDGQRGSQGGPWGDGGYISEMLKMGDREPELFQDLYPGQIVSYKWQKPAERVGARVVCYHGPPRPHETGWAP